MLIIKSLTFITISALLGVLTACAQPTPTLEVLSDKLQSPWGIDFLPDGKILISEKYKGLTLLSKDAQQVLASVTIDQTQDPARMLGLPIDSGGQGGVLDVAVDPDFATNQRIYFSFSQPVRNGFNAAAVASAKLVKQNFQDASVIYRQTAAPETGGLHYGSRLVFDSNKKHLFVTLGERYTRDKVQDLSTSIGKVVYIKTDGTPATSERYFAATNALPELVSVGHRNPQGAAIHPITGELWISEHGPAGGDEINRISAGANYGWPNVSYGCEYFQAGLADCEIGGGVHAPNYTEPLMTWVPESTAPAGMTFYTSNEFPLWTNNLFMAALAGRAVWRIELTDDNKSISKREKLFADLGKRFRDVQQGVDGRLYFLTDDGQLLRMQPQTTTTKNTL